MSSTHHIRQYHLHVELQGSEAAGLALQRQLPGLCHDLLLPALERVLDRLAPPNMHLVIEHLTVEAGSLTLAELELNGAELIAQAVGQVLGEQAARVKLQPKMAENAELKTSTQTVEEAFFYFLQTGRLPWAFRLPVGRSLEQAAVATWNEASASEASLGRFREQLRHVLTTATVRHRLVQQFSLPFRISLLARFWPEAIRLLNSITDIMRGPDYASIEAQLGPALVHFERQLWEAGLARLTASNTATATELVAETWLRLPPEGQQPALAGLLAYHWPGSTDTAAGSSASPLPPRPAQAADKSENDLSKAAEGYYLDNAGLVLLHPFLPRFFEGLGFAENDQLQQPDRALSLLHFLATGQLVAPEHELTLPKLLCAVPQTQPTTADVALTTSETDEAIALLEAVVHHWSALRSTSPDGLRGTFLTRPGKLTRRPDGDWLLQVEPQSYDILLDQLPWGISMIQLPWMPEMLRVEWG
jgi:hypothetical protein